MKKQHRREPRKIVTGILRSYGEARHELIPETIDITEKYANNRTGLPHHPTRVRERVMRKFKSVRQPQLFLNIHAAVFNMFNLGFPLVPAKTYGGSRLRSFAYWKYAAAV